MMSTSRALNVFGCSMRLSAILIRFLTLSEQMIYDFYLVLYALTDLMI